MSPALLLHLASTWTLVGLIWVIQLLAYPQFRHVGPAEFSRYHMAHCWRIGLLIVPLLAVEAGTAGWLLWRGHREGVFLVSVALIGVIWLSTAVLQAPMHTKLMQGFDAGIIRRLIWTNWLRTLAWTARGILLGCLVAA